jgi:hypothetical protein
MAPRSGDKTSAPIWVRKYHFALLNMEKILRKFGFKTHSNLFDVIYNDLGGFHEKEPFRGSCGLFVAELPFLCNNES